MRLRYHVTELSQIIHKELDIDPYDVAFDFLQRWLLADPKIFLYENRRELESPWKHARLVNPDLFYTVEGPKNGIGEVLGKPEFMEFHMTRSSLLTILGEKGSTNNYFKRLEARFICDSEYTDLVNKMQKQDIELTQWSTFHQMSACMALVLRYCHESFEVIPKIIKREFETQFRDAPKRGLYKGSKPATDQDYDHLLWLLEAGLLSLRQGGVQDAAIQIKEVWDIQRSIDSIERNIRKKYTELWSKSL